MNGLFTISLVLCGLVLTNSAFSQKRAFSCKIVSSGVTFASDEKPRVVELSLTIGESNKDKFFDDYVITVGSNSAKSNLEDSKFSIDFKPTILSKIENGHKFNLTLLPNDELGQTKDLSLEIVIKSEKDKKLDQIENTEKNSGIMLKIEVNKLQFSSKILAYKGAIIRSATNTSTYELTINKGAMEDNAIFDDYLVHVIPVSEKTNLPFTDFSVDFKTVTLRKLNNGYKFYLTIQPEKQVDKAREIYLKLQIESEVDKDLKKIHNIEANPDVILPVGIQGDTLKSYNYLAYIGTNFDLVDGLKPDNLFFAVNIFQEPRRSKNVQKRKYIKEELRAKYLTDAISAKDQRATIKKAIYGDKEELFGFSTTLFGNRAFISEDIQGRATYRASQKAVANQDSIEVIFESGNLVERKVSDNLGASFSLLLPFVQRMKEDNILKFFWAPQLEFVWRRISSVKTYRDVAIAKTVKEYSQYPIDITITPKETTAKVNNYDFKIGIASFFVSHEGENLSLRLQPSLGVVWNLAAVTRQGPRGNIDLGYDGQANLDLGVRLWLTEATSGITLGGEFSGRLTNNPIPFFNVTISKALSFKNIGSVFSPVTTR